MVNKLKDHLRSPKVYWPLILIAVTACLPIFQRDPYILRVIILIGIYTVYSSSWNLLAYSGQASLGHAAFFGIGCYMSTLLARHVGITPWLGMFIGSAVASGIGFLVGLTCVRLREWFLAMVTFGFAVIVQAVTNELRGLTYGTSGFAPQRLFNSAVQYYYAILFLAATSVFIIYFTMKSKTGLAFNAIRENESEAKTMGVNTTKYKLVAFMISTFFAGLAGAFYGHYTTWITSGIYHVENSFLPLMMSIIGGLGTIEGPIIGSVLITFIKEILRVFDPLLQLSLGPIFTQVSYVGPPIRIIFLGVFFVLVVIFLPKGISSLLRKALKR